jgi:hypothetical protein
MSRKRNRTQQPEQSLQERIESFTRNVRAAAKRLPPGAERADLTRKARDSEAAANIERWLSSPGLQKPR